MILPLLIAAQGLFVVILVVVLGFFSSLFYDCLLDEESSTVLKCIGYLNRSAATALLVWYDHRYSSIRRGVEEAPLYYIRISLLAAIHRLGMVTHKTMN